MSQNIVDFSGNPTGAELMDDYLDKELKNILTSNSGIQRPSYADAGTKWIDTSATPWLLKMYDGTDDVVIGTINPLKHKFIVSTPMTTQGDIITQGEDGNPTRIAAGANGTVLTSNGPGKLPSYKTSNYQLVSNLSQTLDDSTTKYPCNNAVKTQIDLKANNSDVLHKTGDETKSGVLTVKKLIAGRGDGVIIKGTDYDYNLRSTGSNFNGCALIKNNEPNYAAFNATDKNIVIGSSTIPAVIGYMPSDSSSTTSKELVPAGWVNSRITSVMNSYCGLPNYNSGVAIPTTSTPAPYNCLVIVGVTSAHNSGWLKVNNIHFQIGQGRDDSHDSWLSLIVPKGVSIQVGDGPNFARYYRLAG